MRGCLVAAFFPSLFLFLGVVSHLLDVGSMLLSLQRRQSQTKKESEPAPVDAQSEASIALFRSLLARLSGKAPENSSDFSNLEELNEPGVGESSVLDTSIPKKVEEARKVAREDIPGGPTKHRRQSYFRVRTIVMNGAPIHHRRSLVG